MISNLLIYAQMFGAISILLGLISFAVKSKDKIFLFNGLSNLIKSCQYLLLSGYTGAISCFLAVLRNIIFGHFKKGVPIYIVILFILASIFFQFKAINSFADIIPIFNICFFAICLSSNNEKTLKIGEVVTCITAICYDFIFKAYVSFTYDIIALFVASFSYYYFFVKKVHKKRIEKLA